MSAVGGHRCCFCLERCIPRRSWLLWRWQSRWIGKCGWVRRLHCTATDDNACSAPHLTWSCCSLELRLRLRLERRGALLLPL